MGIAQLINPDIGSNPFYQALDGSRNRIMGLGAALGTGTLNGFAQTLPQYLQPGMQADQQRADQMKAEEQANQQRMNALEYLRGQGANDLVGGIEGGMIQPGEAFKMYMERQAGANQPVKGTEIAGRLVNPMTGEVMADFSNGGSEQATMGLTPIWGTDGNGNPVLGQMSNQGGVQIADMPEGVTFGKDPIRLDAGTHFVLLDPVTRQQIGTVPKENYQEAFDTAQGRTEGQSQSEARLAAPQAIANGETMLSQIDGVLNDPNLWQAVGLGGMLPAIPNTEQAGVVTKIDQLQGQAFLQAFETLKGGGQITEVEGKKATDAIARLNRAQNLEDFKQALQELRDIVNIGLERARQQAAPQNNAQTQQPSAVPQGAQGADNVVDFGDYF